MARLNFNTDIFNQRPEFLDAGFCFGGDEEDGFELVRTFECGDAFAALVAAEAVRLGGDDGELAAGVAEEVDELLVAFLRWNVGVDEADTEREGGALGEIRVDEGGPAGGDGL